MPRSLHPVAWWAWALGLGTAATRTTNPLLLGLIVACVALVVAARRTEAPWARSFRSYVVLAAVVIGVRVVFAVIVGRRFGVTQLFALPEVRLPAWAVGISLGGPVTAEQLLTAVFDGARLATLLICIGAANTLANPRRLLRCVPTALYEIGTTVVIALSVAPQLAESAQRVHRARQLRAAPERGLRALRATAMPVLADALDRSISLAAAMDARGFGRSRGTDATASAPRVDPSGVAVLSGLAGVCIGLYGLLDATAPGFLGLPVLLAGTALGSCGLLVAQRRARPTVYRPDVWRIEEWAVLATGAVPAVATVVGWVPVEVLAPSTDPLAWPTLPVTVLALFLAGGLAAWLAPPPEVPR